MSAGQHDIVIEQGASWRLQLEWQDSDEQPIDLTPYKARLQVRKTYADTATLLSLTSTDGSIALGGLAGTIVATATATQTAGLPYRARTYAVWDLELEELATGQVIRLLAGRARIDPEVTR